MELERVSIIVRGDLAFQEQDLQSRFWNLNSRVRRLTSTDKGSDMATYCRMRFQWVCAFDIAIIYTRYRAIALTETALTTHASFPDAEHQT
jgi:hypothetical protein